MKIEIFVILKRSDDPFVEAVLESERWHACGTKDYLVLEWYR
jgi:hypothetical protein